MSPPCQPYLQSYGPDVRIKKNLQAGFCGKEEFKNLTSWQSVRGRNTVTVTAQPFCGISDQQEAVECCSYHSLLTVKDT